MSEPITSAERAKAWKKKLATLAPLVEIVTRRNHDGKLAVAYGYRRGRRATRPKPHCPWCLETVGRCSVERPRL